MNISKSPSNFIDVAHTLIERELRIRYKGSLLGILWAVLSPLGTVLILFILFSRFLPLGIPNFASFIYSALLPWTWFQASVQTSAGTLNDNRDLVRKPFFPRPVLPAVVTGSNFILYLLALPVLFVLLLLDGVPLDPALAWLPLIWLGLAVFTLGVSLWVAALGVLIRDIQHLLSVVMLLWFYLTPIFYDPNLIHPAYTRWLMLNPTAALIHAHRQAALYGQPPDLGSLVPAFILGLLVLLSGIAFFRSMEDFFVEEV
jgi:lipopolysaccharide transport system permease protein